MSAKQTDPSDIVESARRPGMSHRFAREAVRRGGKAPNGMGQAIPKDGGKKFGFQPAIHAEPRA